MCLYLLYMFAASPAIAYIIYETLFFQVPCGLQFNFKTSYTWV